MNRFYQFTLWFAVFTQPNLEKAPEMRVPPSEIFRTPKPGTMDWQFASPEHKQLVEETMSRLRERVDQRRVLLKPVFQDFDRHNNGHITRQQFRQVNTKIQWVSADRTLLELLTWDSWFEFNTSTSHMRQDWGNDSVVCLVFAF